MMALNVQYNGQWDSCVHHFVEQKTESSRSRSMSFSVMQKLYILMFFSESNASTFFLVTSLFS